MRRELTGVHQQLLLRRRQALQRAGPQGRAGSAGGSGQRGAHPADGGGRQVWEGDGLADAQDGGTVRGGQADAQQEARQVAKRLAEAEGRAAAHRRYGGSGEHPVQAGGTACNAGASAGKGGVLLPSCDTL